MTTDLVWVVGGSPDEAGREELRYSIRSAVENFTFDYRDVVIVGDIPEWFTGVKFPLDPKPGKWENQRASLAAYLNHPGAADEVVILNDDHYIIEPVTEVEPIHDKATASKWNATHGKHDYSCWQCAVKACAAWMVEHIGADIHVYESHTPLRFSVPKLRDLINEYPADLPFMVGEAFALAGIGGPGRAAGNAKAKGHDSLDHKLGLPMPYISGNPDSWMGGLGGYIKAMHPSPCRWEW